jgi:Ca2+-binding RTX toxin-like protein
MTFSGSAGSPALSSVMNDGKPVLTLPQIIEQLQTQWGWYGTGVHLQQPTTNEQISFSIPTIRYSPLDDEAAGWLPPSAILVQQARLAFALWDDLIAPSIVEIPLMPDGADADNLPESSAAITLGRTRTTDGDGTYASDITAVPVTGPGDYPLSPSQVWLSANWSTNTDPGFQIGRYGLQTLVHEIGHSLGLSHPGLYNAGENRVITYAQNALYAQDTRKYTVMSYFDADADGSGAQHRNAAGVLQYGSTPLLHDIAAIQAKYGADMTTRVDDTVYGFNSTAGRDVFDFSVSSAPIVAIWDAGGEDTLDLSGYQMDQSINLKAGTFSDVGGLTSNLAIAFGAEVEDAIGGTGNDRIMGNADDNFLSGMAGNDVLAGLDGDDRLMGYDGNDLLQGGNGDNLIDGGRGYDAVNLLTQGRRGEAFSETGGYTERAHSTGTDYWEDVEVAFYADGRMVFDADDRAAQVLRLYEAVLDRTPDQTGLNHWSALLQAGSSMEQIADILLSSAEFTEQFGAGLDDGTFVDLIHTHLIGSVTSPADRAIWTADLQNGTSRITFVAELADSAGGRHATAEALAAGIWDLDENAAFVARAYVVALDRAPDLGGLIHWHGHKQSGASDLDIIGAISQSEEYRALYGSLDTASFVDSLYANALDRSSDTEGRLEWLSQLESGVSRTAILLQFANSAELDALTAPVIRSEDHAHQGILFA